MRSKLNQLQTLLAVTSTLLILMACSQPKVKVDDLHDGVTGVKINDSFWGPKFKQWRTTTLNDVFDKFEGKYNPQISPSLKSDFE